MDIENGIIKDWNDEKGYGFIIPKEGGKNIFFHINSYSHRHKRPKQDIKVQYYISTDKNGRPCAIDVAPIKGHKNNGREIRQKLFSLFLFGVFSLVLYSLLTLGKIPIQIVGLYGVASVIAFVMYAKDKNAAEWGKWRTPESTLHFLSLIGGWPGAKIAQGFLRHKSSKVSFKVTYWSTVVINCGMLYWFTTPAGSMWLRNILKT
jgi:uncharacterized membrane protein YsdA (DUF1294 family)/cold shock CspA family protein